MADIKEDEREWFYSDIVKEHFMDPHNIVRSEEELEEMKPNGEGQMGSPECGDIMKIWIRVEDGRIKACKWKTFGCASAIASTSILSDMVTENGGMTIEDAMKITPKDILDRLGGLPKMKIHCSVLGDQALRAAIEDYKKK